ncbi:hypothetical protein PILCRDRAFT_813180, partial [Piloderma croceum F 1598]
MPFVYSVTTVVDSNKWHSSDETRDTTRTLYSTLKSANKAAREWAKENKDEDDEDGPGDEGRYSSGGCYSESWDASKYESYSVEVEPEEIFGPDLMKGERDEPDTDDEREEDEEDSDGQSSEVEIVSPPAKRSRT